MLVDFQASFTVRLTGKFEMKCFAILAELRLVTDTDTQTHDQDIYSAEHSSRGKKTLDCYPVRAVGLV